MGRVDSKPFANAIKSGAASVGKRVLSELLIPNIGLIQRKQSHLLFTQLLSSEFGETKKGRQQLKYPDVEVWVDPQNISVKRKVITNKQLTKGGWVTQFWGHDLTQINISSYSGYYGVSKGRSPLVSAVLGTTDKIGSVRKAKGFKNKLKATGSEPTEGIVDPLKIFEKIQKYVYDYRFDGPKPHVGNPIINMVYEDTVYTGYMENFNYKLDAKKPFVIDYNFTFIAVAAPKKFQFLTESTPGVSFATRAFQKGFTNTVSGTISRLSQAGIGKATEALNGVIDKAGNKIGIANIVDTTPSKVILS